MPFFIACMLSRKTVVPIELIDIEEDGSHLIIKAKINNKAARLLIDTGASRSVFDKERILSFVHESTFSDHDKFSTGLGTDSMPTSIAVIKTFKIGEMTIKDFEIVLLDLSHVNGSYQKMGLPPIDGVLGNDVMVDHKAVVDYGKLELKLRK